MSITAEKCKICGKTEWHHVCGGPVTIAERETETAKGSSLSQAEKDKADSDAFHAAADARFKAGKVKETVDARHDQRLTSIESRLTALEQAQGERRKKNAERMKRYREKK